MHRLLAKQDFLLHPFAAPLLHSQGIPVHQSDTSRSEAHCVRRMHALMCRSYLLEVGECGCGRWCLVC